jgi:hypothetical protein
MPILNSLSYKSLDHLKGNRPIGFWGQGIHRMNDSLGNLIFSSHCFSALILV